MEIKTRQIVQEDLDAIMEIQEASYSKEYQEGRETFEKMFEGYPEGFKIVLVDDEIAGYVFYHPAFEDKLQDLNETTLEITGNENCMYLHDMAIHPKFRKLGLTRKLFECFDKATKEKGFRKQALVAVQGSSGFWEKYGFVVTKDVVYGGLPSHYMKREIKN